MRNSLLRVERVLELPRVFRFFQHFSTLFPIPQSAKSFPCNGLKIFKNSHFWT